MTHLFRFNDITTAGLLRPVDLADERLSEKPERYLFRSAFSDCPAIANSVKKMIFKSTTKLRWRT
jgi:hypothetical protein